MLSLVKNVLNKPITSPYMEWRDGVMAAGGGRLERQARGR